MLSMAEATMLAESIGDAATLPVAMLTSAPGFRQGVTFLDASPKEAKVIVLEELLADRGGGPTSAAVAAAVAAISSSAFDAASSDSVRGRQPGLSKACVFVHTLAV